MIVGLKMADSRLYRLIVKNPVYQIHLELRRLEGRFGDLEGMIRE